MILRIEDTDQTRKVEGAMEALIENLSWAGINFNEGPNQGGEFGPYIQSERLKIYQYVCQFIILFLIYMNTMKLRRVSTV